MSTNSIQDLQQVAATHIKALGGRLLLFTFEDYKRNRVYLLLTPNQKILRTTAYGAGGAVHRPDYYCKVKDLTVGDRLTLAVNGSNHLWQIKCIETVDDLTNYEVTDENL